MKTYTFTPTELVILREACIEYKHFLKKEAQTTQRLANVRTAQALAEMFKDDVRKLK